MNLSLHAEAKADAVPLALVVQSLNILSMDACALEEQIQDALLENPLLEASASGSGNESRDLMFAQLQAPVSFRDELHQQLGCMNISEPFYGLASFLIDCLDEDGYLREDLAELAKICHASLSEMEQALAFLQQLDPPGVGCQSLSQCLKLQLLAAGDADEIALDLIEHHLPELAEHRIPPDLYPADRLDQAIRAILRLSPRPCADFYENQTQYIVPEIHVYFDEDGTLCASLMNQPSTPVLSPMYRDYLKAGSELDRAYVRGQLNTARSFLHALEMRTHTMERIIGFILEKQQAFFRLGKAEKKSVSLSDLAEALGVNVSTVSRAVAGKYVEFRGTTFPLRDLFSIDGVGGLSRDAIIAKIHRLLAEDASLSDSKIAGLLAQDGVKISRRTVNKYRHME